MRYTKFIVSLVPLLSIFTSCVAPYSAPNQQADANQTAQTVITFGVDDPDLYAPLIHQFHQQHPDIHVQVRALPDPNGSPGEIIRSQAQAADVSIVNGLSPEDLTSRVLLDLRPFIDADPSFDPADFYPGLLDTFTYQGHLYQLPSQFHVPLFQYNQQLWIERGLPPPRSDWRWHDLIAAAQQVAHRRSDGSQVYGIAAGIDGFYLFLALLADQQIYPFTQPNFTLDHPEVVQVLQQLRQLAQQGVVYVSKPRASTDTQFVPIDYDTLIRNQQLGVWLASDYSGLAQHTADAQFTIGTLPVPPAPLPPEILLNSPSYVMSAGTQQPQAAWQLIAFLSHTTLAVDASLVPPVVRAIPARRSLHSQVSIWEDMAGDPEARTAMQVMLARPLPVFPNGSLNPVRYTAISALLGALIRNQLPIEQALARSRQSAAAMQAWWPTPLPTAAPFTVNTPLPELADKTVETIAFGTSGLPFAQIEPIAQRFQIENPTIRVLLHAPGTKGAQSLDCFARHSWLVTDQASAVRDLRPLIEADPAFGSDDYPAAWWAPYQQAGRIDGLPLQIVVRWLAYQRATFANNHSGVPQADWTIERLIALAVAHSQTVQATPWHSFADVTPDLTIPFFFGRYQAARWHANRTMRTPNYTDARVVQALQAYVLLMRTAKPPMSIGLPQSDADRERIRQLIVDHRVGMWFEFGPIDRQADDAVGIAPPPFGNQGLTLDDFSVLGLHIAEQTEHSAACWTWIRYLSTQLAVITPGELPARRSLAQSTAFTQTLAPEVQQVYQAYLQLADQPLQSPAINSGWDIQENRWLTNAVIQVIKGQSIESALEDVQNRIEAYQTCLKQGSSTDFCTTQH